MAKQKKPKQMHNQPVSFNLADPDQKELFDHAMKRPNFSGYIKRLIQRDMESGSAPSQKEEVKVYEQTNDIDPNGFI